MKDGWLTVKELGEYLSLSPARIYELVKGQAIPYVKMGQARSSTLRFKKSDIDAWMKRKEKRMVLR